MNILLIEDSPPTRDLILRSLETEAHRVETAARISTARRLAGEKSFDLFIIDIQLPDGSGLDLCRELRAAGLHTPILFLTARGEVGDRVTGLDAGADDYMRKPFALAELKARVRALGRRGGTAPPPVVECGGLSIDFTGRRFLRDRREIPLTGREWSVLEILVSRAGRLVQRHEILDAAWGETTDGASVSLDVIVSRLRRKLGGDESRPAIRTVRGEGFVFEATE